MILRKKLIIIQIRFQPQQFFSQLYSQQDLLSFEKNIFPLGNTENEENVSINQGKENDDNEDYGTPLKKKNKKNK